MDTVITILKVVGCENCLLENKLLLWGPESEAPCHWAILAICWKKIAIWMIFCTFLEQLEKAKFQRFGRLSKNLFCPVQSAPTCQHTYW